jgi:NAD(P)-dependent dehydrogenase (short-subunit alcohol dehydrogenase family)
VCDVVEPEDVRALSSSVAARGPLRALAHVVGLSPSMADGPTILTVNLTGPVLVEEAFVELAELGTAAVFIASLAGHTGELSEHVRVLLDDPLSPDFTASVVEAVGGELDPGRAYQISKAGLIAMCRRRAPKWGARGARIMSLSPGLIASPMGAREHEANPGKQRILDAVPLGREGTMIEIAEATEFLLSDRASYITGTDLLVDGGVAAALQADAEPAARYRPR